MQFDVYENRNPASRDRFPYLLDVQAELLDSLETRIVIPLMRESLAKDQALTRLMPILQVGEEPHLAFTPQLAGVARRQLGPCVGNVKASRAEILAALDLLLD